jgi:polygalacturonase
MMKLQRRSILKGIAAGAVSAVCPLPSWAMSGSLPESAGRANWAMADAIRRSIVKPVFPKREFNIKDFGAIADGKTNNSKAIHLAIEKCASGGGGRVLINEGVYCSGPIHLKSNVNLHIEKNTTLSFLPDPQLYLPPVLTRWEGMELMGYSPLIYAYGQENIAITGGGVLSGNADRNTWWPWKGNKEWGVDGQPSQKSARDKLFADAENNVPPEKRVYADGAYLRPPFIQPYRCRNVLIDGITITNAPFWLLHPVLCENVSITGVTCNSLGPNSDGCDPESCKNVLIENCYFDTGDDCIAIKSGRNADGRRLNTPSENILIAGCKMQAGHGGVVIGSEISGGARNIFVENCQMSSPDLERGIRIKTNSHRGGIIQNFNIRNIDIGTVQDAIVINFYYEEGDTGKFDPAVSDISISNLRCSHAKRVFHVRGYQRSPIKGLTLTDIRFDKADEIGVIENVVDLDAEDLYINGKKHVLQATHTQYYRSPSQSSQALV